MLAICLLMVGLIARFVIHVPNFTPVIAIALFGGFYLNKRYAVLLPLGLMMVTDALLGLHNVIFFTWGSLALIALMGVNLQDKKNVMTVAGSGIVSAIAFFVFTNFGVWLMTDLYTKDFAGLMTCYQMAIPFFRTTLISTAVYTIALFSLYELIASRVKNAELAKAVL